MPLMHPPLRLDHLEREGVRARMLADWTEEVDDLVKRRVPKAQWARSDAGRVGPLRPGDAGCLAQYGHGVARDDDERPSAVEPEANADG